MIFQDSQFPLKSHQTLTEILHLALMELDFILYNNLAKDIITKQKSNFLLKYKDQCVKDPWCSKGLKNQKCIRQFRVCTDKKLY